MTKVENNKILRYKISHRFQVKAKLFTVWKILCLLMEQLTFKNVNNCLNTSIYSYLLTSGGQSSNLFINVIHFFNTSVKLDICGNSRQLFSCIGVYYTLFHYLGILYALQHTIWQLNHRDRTRVQMPAKIFPHLKVKY